LTVIRNEAGGTRRWSRRHDQGTEERGQQDEDPKGR
jgi:hypothetical protein